MSRKLKLSLVVFVFIQLLTNFNDFVFAQTASVRVVACLGGATGSATVTATGGLVWPLTFTWSPNVITFTDSIATGLSTGSYTCIITDAMATRYDQPVVVAQPTLALSSNILAAPANCNGESSGSTFLNLTKGGTPPYSYLWSTGDVIFIANGLIAGTYSCVITDFKGCTLNKQTTVTEPPVISSSILGGDVLCNGENSGWASVVPSGGVGPYTYSWFPSGGATSTANNISSGTYTCVITDSHSCELQKSVTITEPSVITSTIGGADALCNGGNSGYAGVDAVGGTGSYSYSWTPSGGAANSALNLVAGTYTCLIADANGCNISKSFVVGEPSAISSTIVGQNVLCNGGNTGYAGVNPTGGTGSYTYVWSPTGDVTNSALDLISGDYSCDIMDANNCVLTKTITITEPTPLSSGITGSDVLCNGGNDGWASVTPSGGTAPYTYSWSPSGGIAATENNLLVGTYTCIVTDANLCEISKTIVINEPVALNALISGTDLSCNGVTDGTATVVVSDGTAPYTYFWNPNGGTNATVNGLSAGTYTCEITDAHLCTVAYDITIAEPAALTTSISSGGDLTCPGATDGIAFVSGTSGGTGGYSYLWTPVGGTADLATNLSAGSYTCTITDANLCEIAPVIVIAEPSAIVISISKTNAACNGGSDGSAQVVVTGGTGPYTYLWSPMGDVTESINNLTAGTYTCNVTDNASCEAFETVTILESGSMSVIVSQVDALCNGDNNGAASVDPSGGVGPYTYEWSPSFETTQTISNLVAGTYTCFITDANSCAITQTVTINEPAVLNSSISKIDITCNGLTDGRAGVIPIGGTGPYSYLWTPSGGAAATATNLAVGNYTCTITDVNLCSELKSISISQPSVLSASVSGTNVLCNGGNSGFAVATPSGGTAPYSYSWTPSGGSTATGSNLTVGSYTCFVSDANSCLTSKTVTISQPSALAATPSQTNILCFGTNAGSAKVAVSGGVGPYSYSWTPSGGAIASASSLFAGSYSCTVSDANSCSIVQSVTITQSPSITATITQTNVLCNGANTGSASISAIGGLTPYTYLWMPGSSTNTAISSLLANNYTFTIQDANNCSFTSVVAITQPAAITAAISSVNPTCLVLTGSASVTVAGGTSPYSYNWTPTGGNAATASSLSAKTYSCTVTDANGCNVVKVATISNPTVLVTSITSTNIACNGDNKGTANMVVSGGTLPYTYSWSVSGGATTAAVVGLAEGGYTCTVTDALSCKATHNVDITRPFPSSSVTNLTCAGGNNGSISFSVSGGTTPYNYLWTHNGATTSSVSSLIAGNYTFVVTDAFLCVVQKTVPIVSPLALTATINKIDASCYGGATGIASVSPQGVPVSSGLFGVLWKPSGGTGYVASGLTVGTYTCIVTDGNGCQISKVTTIAQPTAIVVAVSKTDALCNGSASGVASLTTSGGVSPYSYSWYPSGGAASTASSLSAGTYTCTILDANFCLYTQSVSISQPASITVVTSKTDALCNGGASGMATVVASGGTAPYAYSWSPITNFNSSVTGLVAGTYTYAVTDINNCVFSKSINISEPTSIAASLSQTNVSCDGNTLGFASVTPSGGTIPYTYSWSPLGGSSYSTSKILTNGSYTCEITDANNCKTQKNVVIIQPPLPTVSLTLPKDTFCTNSGTVNIVGLPAGGIYSGSGVTSNHFNVDGLTAGSYTLTYTYNDGVCANTATVEALIDPCTGIYDLENENLYLKLYPNPFNNSATIEVGKDVLIKGNVFFEVFDGLGRSIKKERITQEFTTISRDNIPNGLYYYRLYNEFTLFNKGMFVVE